jgi:DNA polymerase elongation subunit (family B)
MTTIGVYKDMAYAIGVYRLQLPEIAACITPQGKKMMDDLRKQIKAEGKQILHQDSDSVMISRSKTKNKA